MANECRKACYRRLHDPAFHQRYFVGTGLDVGAGEDSLSKYAFMFPRIQNVVDWNHSDGDGTDLEGVKPNSFDFVHSSHSLEHMRDPYTALQRWIEVLKRPGYIVATVPDYQMYEHARWPSDNKEHTHAFLISDFARDGSPQYQTYVNLTDLLPFVCRSNGADIIKIERLESTFDFSADPNLDQTCFGHGAAEACIEFILRKY